MGLPQIFYTREGILYEDYLAPVVLFGHSCGSDIDSRKSHSCNTVLNAGFMLLNSTPMPSLSVKCATVALHWKKSVCVRIFTRIVAPLENGSGISRYAPKMLKSLTMAGRTSAESIALAVAVKAYLGARRSGRLVGELSGLFAAIDSGVRLVAHIERAYSTEGRKLLFGWYSKHDGLMRQSPCAPSSRLSPSVARRPSW